MNRESVKAEYKYLLLFSFIIFALFVLWSIILFGVDGIKSFDKYLAESITEIRFEPLLSFFLSVTKFGGAGIISALLFGVAALLFIWRWKEALFMLFAAVSASALSLYLLKEIFHRPRPELALISESGYSYPSAHAALSLTFYGIVAYLLCRRSDSKYVKISIWTAAAVLTALVGFSRIYIGVHYPGDVIGGYLVGAFWVLTAAAFLSREK